jgi:arabinofuranosyltransferase
MNDRKPFLILLLLMFFIILLRVAWLGDDSYITMRSVDNWVNGYGLTWNPGERVQTFTHPLWLLLISGIYAVLGNAYFSLIGLSLLMSLVVMLIFLSQDVQDEFILAFGWLLLILSRSFMDYSTSGLENPLSHLLALSFALIFIGKSNLQGNWRTFVLALLAGLAVFNRMDTLLLYLPALALLFWNEKSRRTLGLMLAGFVPFMLWGLFAIFYYGFFFPNTYYAKLNTSIPTGNLIHQGFIYYLNQTLFDPLTLVVIACGLLTTLAWGETRQRAIAAGIVLYLAYVVYIGGDLMSGRFFSIAMLLSVVLLLQHLGKFRWQHRVFFGLAAVFLAFLAPTPSFMPPNTFDRESAHRSGASDERAYYYGASGLMRWGRYHKLPGHEWVDEGIELRKQGPQVHVASGMGYLGFFAGPQVHVIDRFALSDPLLSRLPIIPGIKWDIGHIRSRNPSGLH